ncbi:hypothetical protein ETAA8_03030 [Anatilimnocola aggregata]|uniref:Twin-arginine translocation signal domain-containing protein n=1 Tax=Anatilimnocola aggregata TaxID=2528021 RepID=A0A517Y4X4_9BACT|nr:twin-arginine translocation signal domain-containing protein [Anatilimnocola aggregata]QDU25240.1 hypothetical protein ETAA8_03030 [Anatilimnocola aggregata]
MTHVCTSRRRFLQATSLGATAVAIGPFSSLASLTPVRGADTPRRMRVAAIFTELRHRSHAYNILMNFMGRCMFRGQWQDLGMEVVSFYADQFPANDMTREVSQRFRVPLYSTIDEALCVGGKELKCDAVLLIGEHGDYPDNKLGQRMYPRKQFFDQVVRTMRRSERYVPVFNDKHLSYRWDWAKEMYDQARELKIPLMAGSSVPLAERRPMWEMPNDARVESAVSVHGGGMEVYDFHAFEVLQSFLEFRKGGETGIRSVRLVSGDAFTTATKQKDWPAELYAAAQQAEEQATTERQQRPIASTGKPHPDHGDHALFIDYVDGLRATVVKHGSSSNRWNFACRLAGEEQQRATALINGPWGNFNLFSALSHAIATFFKSGRSPYPVERTLIASGLLEAAMRSHQAGGKVIDTPELQFAYPTADFANMRETGASWKVITAATPQPTTFAPHQ